MKDLPPDIVEIERLGGLAGFGGRSGRLRSFGQLDLAQLEPAQRQAVEALLQGSPGSAGTAVPDGFRYRLSRVGHVPASVEIFENAVPDFVRDAVHDELL